MIEFVQSNLYVNQACQAALFGTMHYLNGRLVLNFNVKVNYTRKINQFGAMLIPLLLTAGMAGAAEPSKLSTVLSFLMTLLYLIVLSQPVRERWNAAAVMFASVDRPEDRPHTVLWISTQFFASYMAIIPAYLAFDYLGHRELVFVPILVTAIGDGLAEPVGIRFGTHKYKVRGLFTDKTFTRSLEGSACVFITSIVMLLAFQQHLTGLQLGVALVIFPVLMTLAEAWSPHTWDNPFMIAVGSAFLLLLTFVH